MSHPRQDASDYRRTKRSKLSPKTTKQPAHHAPHRAWFDHQTIPHILDTVIAYASHASLLRLRATSHYVRDRADARLWEHVVVRGANPGDPRRPANTMAEADPIIVFEAYGLGRIPHVPRSEWWWQIATGVTYATTEPPPAAGTRDERRRALERVARLLESTRRLDIHSTALSTFGVTAFLSVTLDPLDVLRIFCNEDGEHPASPFPSARFQVVFPPSQPRIGREYIDEVPTMAPDSETVVHHLKIPLLAAPILAVEQDDAVPKEARPANEVFVFSDATPNLHPADLRWTLPFCQKWVAVMAEREVESPRRVDELVSQLARRLRDGTRCTIVDLAALDPAWLQFRDAQLPPNVEVGSKDWVQKTLVRALVFELHESVEEGRTMAQAIEVVHALLEFVTWDQWTARLSAEERELVSVPDSVKSMLEVVRNANHRDDVYSPAAVLGMLDQQDQIA
ncbi:uncharacterized protein LOC62_02G002578 [Vanrija pseudolonga]|uniref:Uncharacterized protein n=1 Tax=Vanrija pseudolonga TaxID=143232 RepID=A0AAF0Y722_9TREE|nr:hypothetical protein LOC62_02G002578 [Vanrija pseudolonga]